MAKKDPRNILICYGGYNIPASDFHDADITISTGGATSEIVHGIGGGKSTNVLLNKGDTVKFALFTWSSHAKRLKEYHSTTKQCEWNIRDNNLGESYDCPIGQVQEYDDVVLNKEDGIAFTITFEGFLDIT